MNRTTAILALLTLASCSPTKGYEGPELPQSEVSVITLEYPPAKVEVGRASMNGIEFSHSGIALLPGAQSFDIAITVKEPPRNCRTERSFDAWGYQRCLNEEWQRNRRNRSNRYIRLCNRTDYASVTKHCVQDTTEGNCSVDFTTQPGREYVIGIAKFGSAAEISVTEGAHIGTPAKEACSMFRTKVVEVQFSGPGV